MSDWSNSAEQEDEGRDSSCRYRGAAGTQGDSSSTVSFLSLSYTSQIHQLTVSMFSGCWGEDDGVWTSLCLHHQSEERKSG